MNPEFAASLVKKAPRGAALRKPEKQRQTRNSVLQKLVRQLLCSGCSLLQLFMGPQTRCLQLNFAQGSLLHSRRACSSPCVCCSYRLWSSSRSGEPRSIRTPSSNTIRRKRKTSRSATPTSTKPARCPATDAVAAAEPDALPAEAVTSETLDSGGPDDMPGDFSGDYSSRSSARQNGDSDGSDPADWVRSSRPCASTLHDALRLYPLNERDRAVGALHHRGARRRRLSTPVTSPSSRTASIIEPELGRRRIAGGAQASSSRSTGRGSAHARCRSACCCRWNAMPPDTPGRAVARQIVEPSSGTARAPRAGRIAEADRLQRGRTARRLRARAQARSEARQELRPGPRTTMSCRT